MVVNSFALATLYAINKQLLKGLPSSQATFLYKLTVFIFIAPWVLRKGWEGIRTPVLRLHFLRGFLSISGSLCFAYGLKHTNVVNATALGYTEQVLWAMIGVFYFKEKINGMKLLAILMSFSAMILITVPGIFESTNDSSTINFDYYYIFVLAAAFFWSINATIIKVMGKKSVKNEVQAFYGLLFQVLIAYPAAFFEWNWHKIGGTFFSYPTFAGLIDLSTFSLTETQMIQILMLALMYFIHVFAFFLSMKYAEMSTVAPFDYTRLVFTCILAYFLIGEVPQYAVQYIGYIMIICSGVLLTTAERRRRKKEQLEVQIENV